jgi:hypothetical protein
MLPVAGEVSVGVGVGVGVAVETDLNRPVAPYRYVTP